MFYRNIDKERRSAFFSNYKLDQMLEKERLQSLKSDKLVNFLAQEGIKILF